MVDITFIIFGASGDLTQRSIIPALYRLFLNKEIQNFAIIGTAIDDISALEMLNRAKPKILPEIFNEKVWANFISKARYQRLNFNSKADFKELENLISETEKELKLSGNRILYCATGARFFVPITKFSLENNIIYKQDQNNLIKSNLSKNNLNKRFYRIAYEKPFGYNLESAKEINKKIKALLDKSQIFRIDHFIANKAILAILQTRITNNIFEAGLNSKYIENIKIIIDESIGVGARGALYETFGSILDMVQNHLFQILSLVCLDLPKELTHEELSKAKADLLSKVKFENGILGQFEGYTEIQDVNPDSQIDTYSELLFKIKNKRWQNTPILLRTGKELKSKFWCVEINFKISDSIKEATNAKHNYIRFYLDPKSDFAGLKIEFNKAITNSFIETEPEIIEVNLLKNNIDKISQKNIIEPYYTIFKALIDDNKIISVSFDEIKNSWKIVNQIKSKKLKLLKYKKQGLGPKVKLLN